MLFIFYINYLGDVDYNPGFGSSYSDKVAVSSDSSLLKEEEAEIEEDREEETLFSSTVLVKVPS